MGRGEPAKPRELQGILLYCLLPLLQLYGLTFHLSASSPMEEPIEEAIGEDLPYNTFL